jgi:glc operon protein GlcG
MYSKSFLGLDEARAVAEAALAEAAKNPERPCSIAVVDPVGDLVYFARQDRAHPHFNMLALSKAYTSVRFRRDTNGIGEHFKKQGVNFDAFVDPKYTTLPGGMCIKTNDGVTIGAIGVSGRTPEDKITDIDIGKAGLKALSI